MAHYHATDTVIIFGTVTAIDATGQVLENKLSLAAPGGYREAFEHPGKYSEAGKRSGGDKYKK